MFFVCDQPRLSHLYNGGVKILENLTYLHPYVQCFENSFRGSFNSIINMCILSLFHNISHFGKKGLSHRFKISIKY